MEAQLAAMRAQLEHERAARVSAEAALARRARASKGDVIHRLPRINEKGSGWTKLLRVIIVLKYYALESHTRGYARLIAKVWARGARGVVSGASR